MEKFSVYPAGAQGVGLLALRLSLALTIAVRSLSPLPPTIPQILALITAAMLVIGGFVRAAAILAVVMTMARPSAIDLYSAACWLAVIAVATLGPGAYSLDGLLFGRRVIRIDRRRLPPPHDTNR